MQPVSRVSLNSGLLLWWDLLVGSSSEGLGVGAALALPPRVLRASRTSCFASSSSLVIADCQYYSSWLLQQSFPSCGLCHSFFSRRFAPACTRSYMVCQISSVFGRCRGPYVYSPLESGVSKSDSIPYPVGILEAS
jgi:hypothetical protein